MITSTGGLEQGGAFGIRMGSRFHLTRAPALVTRTSRNSVLAVTELRCDTGLAEVTAPIRPEKALVVAVQLRALAFHRFWVRDVEVPVGSFPVGAISILDLECEPKLFLPVPFHCLHFYVSRAALDDLAAEHGVRRVTGLKCPRGAVDPMVTQLALSLLPSLERPQEANRLFVEQLLHALAAHFARAYGLMRLGSSVPRTRLAGWQERRAKELIQARLDTEVSVAELATECRISRSHFARAFKDTTGISPHRWLQACRVDRAKTLLLSSQLPLTTIANRCGFADQSHFSRVFSKWVGVSPSAWRRVRGGVTAGAVATAEND
jgi:AraC family transcriptional regulator